MGIGFPQQRGQSAVPEPTEGGGDGPFVVRLASLEPAEPLHQIEGRAVDLDRINCRPAMEPLAPALGVIGTASPISGGFLTMTHLERR